MYRATKVTVISFKNKRNDEFVYMFAHDTYQAKKRCTNNLHYSQIMLAHLF